VQSADNLNRQKTAGLLSRQKTAGLLSRQKTAGLLSRQKTAAKHQPVAPHKHHSCPNFQMNVHRQQKNIAGLQMPSWEFVESTQL
jgi:hypothetical protein